MTTLTPTAGHRADSSPSAPTWSRPAATIAVLSILSVVCFAVAVPSFDELHASGIGLLATAFPTFAVSILLAAVAFLVAIRANLFRAAVGTALLLLLIERLPSALGTSAPLYAWTYKHLGVVDYISERHIVNNRIDVYQGWPGMFSVTAWFSDVTGVSAQTIAHVFTPLFHFGVFVLVLVFARQRGLTSMQSVLAAFTVETVNWVAQDYFAPQALAFFLAIGFLVLIGGERVSHRRAFAALVVFAAIAVSHQLTPYWLIVLTVLLAVTKRLPTWWLPIAMIIVAGGMLAYNYDTVSHFSLFSADPFSNVQGKADTTTGVLGQRFTGLLMRIVSVGFWIFTLAVLIWRGRTGRTWWTPAVFAFSPFAILLGQSYGNEAIYRVFLYSLPGCAVLIAPVALSWLQARVKWHLLASAVVVLAVAATAQGTFGPWNADRITAEQVDGARALLDQAPRKSYLTPAAPSWPNNMTARYPLFLGQGSVNSDGAGGSTLIRAAGVTNLKPYSSYERIIDAVQQRDRGTTYVYISDQMAIYSWYFGYLPLDSLPILEDRMRRDPRWAVWREGKGYTIFRTTTAMYQGVR